jgi:cell division protease FtsH
MHKVPQGARLISDGYKISKRYGNKFGMSEKLGPLTYGENEDEVFLGRSITRQQHISEETAKKVDLEIKRIVDEGYQKQREFLLKK